MALPVPGVVKHGYCLVGSAIVLLMITALISFVAGAADDFVCSRATYYGSPDCLGTPRGACGYGEFGRAVNDANVAGVSRLWKNGTACGSCYQVRCKAPNVCTDDGVNVVVTDYGEGDHTDFILSPRAYAKMARPNYAPELYSYGVVEVEYRRIPCKYTSGYNIQFKVKEHSKFPHYLAIVLLYQASQYDVVAVELWQEDCKEWRGMRRAYGAVWDMVTPPKGPITLRFQVSSSVEVKWVEVKGVIPYEWEAGAVYDSNLQL
ncbi:Expansin-like B1 [Linum grandiflorum]